LKKELTERQNQIDVLKSQVKVLTKEIEQAHITARENLHFHLAELEKQLAAQTARCTRFQTELCTRLQAELCTRSQQNCAYDVHTKSAIAIHDLAGAEAQHAR
jgi:hypothetical protein